MALQTTKSDIDSTAFPSMLMGTLRRNGSRLSDSINAALENGCFAFDTSPSYGTEQELGQTVKKAMSHRLVSRSELWLQSKVDGWQMQAKRGNVGPFVNASLRSLKADYLDVVLIHWPFEKYLDYTWESLYALKEHGKTRHVGICNIEPHEYFALVDRTGIEADLVQLEVSPIRPCVPQVESFRAADVSVQAYSPLARMTEAIRNNSTIRDIAESHGASIAQLILAWHLHRGIAPIFTSGNAGRIKENIRAQELHLNTKEAEAINTLETGFKWYVNSYCCPLDYERYLA